MTHKIQRSPLIKRIQGWKLSEALKKENPSFYQISNSDAQELSANYNYVKIACI